MPSDDDDVAAPDDWDHEIEERKAIALARRRAQKNASQIKCRAKKKAEEEAAFSAFSAGQRAVKRKFELEDGAERKKKEYGAKKNKVEINDEESDESTNFDSEAEGKFMNSLC